MTMPVHAKGRRPRFFETEGVDELVSIMLEVMAEVATLQERQYVTERVFERAGVKLGEEIEQYELTEEDREVLSSNRSRMLQTVLRVLESEAAHESAEASVTTSQSQSRAA